MYTVNATPDVYFGLLFTLVVFGGIAEVLLLKKRNELLITVLYKYLLLVTFFLMKYSK